MEQIKMTNNEYQLFLKSNASKLWTKNNNYGMKEYTKDSLSVEILPFDLEKYNLSTALEKIINSEFTEEFTNKDGELVLKGFTESEDNWYKITDQLNLKRSMGYYYSGYCNNEDFNFYMTYCEGDLYLYLFTSKEEYKKSLQRTIQWYKENN